MAPASKSADPGLVYSGAVMTEPSPPSRQSKVRSGLSSGGKTGNHTPQHVLMELKHRILVALGKLADRDTQQIAVEELDKVVETLSPDCISACLSCLYDSDMQQKSVVKKECVRLFGSLASLHGDLLIPHLSKIIASIMRRLRDPDTSVRDACVDSIAILSARLLSLNSSSPVVQEKENGATPNGSSVTLATFSKPLFDALSEQNKSVQTGAALCLARVIESAKSPPLGSMARLCPRICKFMSNPNFLARPALLTVIGSLSQVGALGQQQLGLVMPCVLEALENSDWATRKAAAETLTRMGSNLGPSLATFKSSTLQALESCRFDKVKPVRDSVHDATQLWKTLTGTEPDSPGSAKNSDGQESTTTTQLGSPSSVSNNPSSTVVDSPKNENRSNLIDNVKSEKATEAAKKRQPPLTDKKLNPEFFQKLAAKTDEIEVVVPRNCPPAAKEAEVRDDAVSEMDSLQSEPNSKRSVSNNKSSHDSQILSEADSKTTGLRKKSPTAQPIDKTTIINDTYTEVWDGDGHASKKSSLPVFGRGQVNDDRATLHLVQQQLAQLEQQHSSLLQMFQDFMASSQENMFVLQARIRELENLVEDLTCDPAFVGGKRVAGSFIRHDNYTIRPFTRFPPGSEYGDPAFGKTVGGLHYFTDRVPNSGNLSKDMRHPPYRSVESAVDDWDAFGRAPRSGMTGAYIYDNRAAGVRLNNARAPTEVPRADKEDPENDQVSTRRVWDRTVRLGEGPSARSVWQASKDEATLAAIRVAGEDAERSDAESLSSSASRICPPESGSESLQQKNSVHDGQGGKGQFWSLWGSAMEFVHAGDMESAYTEVLCAEDDSMLMRLMRRTGPVLDQFSITTSTEVLHAVGQLLVQQNYFDLCLPWIQQVADMVGNNGIECLDLSLDAKKELLMALQEAASMEMPDGWLGSSIDELLQQLASAWSIDIVPVDGP